MEKIIVIINFNTQRLTEACIRSINKYTPGCKIYVFDNSDKEKFCNEFNNVEVIDNTNGEIIDFEKWLSQYPGKRISGKINNWGSAKHTYSIEKCMEMLNKPFLLLDSDVLIKKDISDFFDESVCCVGEIVTRKTTTIQRFLPFICFINTTMCKNNNIHYFNEKYTDSLVADKEGSKYDTGAWFYSAIKKINLPYKTVKISEYIEHFESGSWRNNFEKASGIKHLSAEDWLAMHKDLWLNKK